MAARKYALSEPEELEGLVPFVKEGRLASLVMVWRVARRRKGDMRWDGAFFVRFSGDSRRTAEVMRVKPGGEAVWCATLRYNLALSWCEARLRQIE